MIHVVAIIACKPGQRAEVLKAAHANLPAVLAEKGCIEYGPTVDAERDGVQTKFGDDTIVVVEKWATLADLDAHAKAPHMAAYAAKVNDMIASRTIHVLKPA
jgi:quinol monooxygenase YgiN